MGKRKKIAIIIVAAILLLACIVVVCCLLFKKPPISREQAAEVVSSAGRAHSETIHIIEAKEEVYDTAVDYLTAGDFDEAQKFFKKQEGYKNSKDYAFQIDAYKEALFKESKKNHIGAARLMAECVLIPGAMEKASDYKAMDEIVTLCQNGEYGNAEPKLNSLTTLSDEEKHSFAFSCKCEYLFWLLEEEDAEEAAQMLAEVMEDPEEVFNNWGSGYDYDTGEYELYGYGYNGAYARRIISYSELGPGKNINLMKMFSDKDEEPDCYYIAVYQYEGKGYYFREFAFSLDGKVLYKPYAKRPSHYAESTSGNVEKIDNPEYVENVEKAHELIGKGRPADAGKLLSVVASDEEYLHSYYGWYGTDEESFFGGNSCDTCIRYFNDSAILFGVYYKGDFEEPIGFFYRYFDGNKIFFAHYDMNGKYLSGWGN